MQSLDDTFHAHTQCTQLITGKFAELFLPVYSEKVQNDWKKAHFL